MIDFKFSPVDDINEKQRILQIPRIVKLNLKKYLYKSIKSSSSKDIILKRNFVKLKDFLNLSIYDSKRK